MSETRYPLGNGNVVRFGYDDCRYGCLCTFPFNYQSHKLNTGVVESLALMGAVLCMSVNGGLQKVDYTDKDEYVIPDCLPQWVRDEVRRVLGDYPEKFDGNEYDFDYEENDEKSKELLRRRYTEIIKWCEESLKALNN